MITKVVNKMNKKYWAVLLTLVLSLTMLAGCGASSADKSAESAGSDKTSKAAGDPNANLSATDYDIEKNYYFNDFNDHSLADIPRQGIATYKDPEEVIYEDLTYEEFVDMLNSEGTYIFTLAGSWCHNSRAMTPSLSAMAKKYGINKIYTYDFDLDNKEDGSTFVRVSDESKDPGADYNYMYGEVIERYLTNMDDWIEYPSNTPEAITYTTSGGKRHTIARAQQPIVVVYNKDAEKPILYAFEEPVDRDAKGVYIKETDDEGNPVTDEKGNEVRKYITEEYEADMQKLFDYVKDNKIKFNSYDEEAFMRKAFPSLADAKQINVKPITYRQYAWMLQQPGNAVYMVGGTYNNATQESIASVNSKAVKEGITVYLFDPNVDAKICEKSWGYKNTGDITESESIGFMNDNLISDSLWNMNTDYKPIMPYVYAFNKDATDEDGVSAPIKALTNDAKSIDDVIEAYKTPIEK